MIEKGLSYVEIVIMIAVISIFSGSVLFNYNTMRTESEVDSDVYLIISELRNSQVNALGLPIDEHNVCAAGVELDQMNNSIIQTYWREDIHGDCTERIQSLSDTYFLEYSRIQNAPDNVRFDVPFGHLKDDVTNAFPIRITLEKGGVIQEIIIDEAGYISRDL